MVVVFKKVTSKHVKYCDKEMEATVMDKIANNHKWLNFPASSLQVVS